MREIPDKIDSKFRFVLLAANRAEHMMQGAVAKVDEDGRKASAVALEEFRSHLVDWDYGPAQEAETVEAEEAPADE
jgi:DNA-directed RNA polymerase omega subunit